MRACVFISMKHRLFQLSRDPRTFFVLDTAIDNLMVARNVWRGSLTCRVLALMGLVSESAPPPSHVASSLQIRRSKFHHAHEGDTPLVSPRRSSRVGVGPVWHAWTVLFLPGQFRQCMLGGMLQHHSWLTAGQRYLTIDVYISHQ
jgi:hypothetical protein